VESNLPESETLAREHLANERTLLSWVRSGINAIQIGILFYFAGRTLVFLDKGSSPKGLSMLGSAWEELAVIGVGIVVLGALLEVAAVIRFIHYKASISKGTFTSAILVYLLVALGLVLLSVAYIIYVISK
jgi:putative membrane protein